MAQKKTFSGRDMGIDLGTANTLVYVRGQGVVLNEPSVVAVNAVSGEVVSVGTEAKSTIGRTPTHIVAVRPLRDGVIADFEMAERMLAHFIRKVAGSRRYARPRVVVCVPSGITGVERRAVVEAATSAGARQVHLIEEPMAAAIGAGLPVSDPIGSMVVDIGGGTTEVAVVSLGGIVAARSVRTAGDAIDAAIMSYVRREHSLIIGERTAEEVKMTIGSAAAAGSWPVRLDRLDRELDQELDPELDRELDDALGQRLDGRPVFGVGPRDERGDEPDGVGGEVEVTQTLPRTERCRLRGRDQVSGLPKTLELDAEQVRRAISEPVDSIIDAVRHTLDLCPPELAGDIMDRGIVLTGGGALLRGLDERLRTELQMPVIVADDPLDCVAIGTGRCVEDFGALRRVLDAIPPSYTYTVARV
ncbi:rod shape-determining protein [Streptantibioticus ferralitis]|uniref:Cell shape-determining protein MreB n=1 Tax=Streptantibioticus ferralitis TaxID=236510 RepID=A0ABT5Z2Q9_9ACTN|nr:rod shape-determining protein [Streptantibioticus ferralitis]MDF2257957.1 rod shape-determining protein [Streptantibioticus ferralitis]